MYIFLRHALPSVHLFLTSLLFSFLLSHTPPPPLNTHTLYYTPCAIIILVYTSFVSSFLVQQNNLINVTELKETVILANTRIHEHHNSGYVQLPLLNSYCCSVCVHYGSSLINKHLITSLT